jgi:hypothetical protein
MNWGLILPGPHGPLLSRVGERVAIRTGGYPLHAEPSEPDSAVTC